MVGRDLPISIDSATKPRRARILSRRVLNETLVRLTLVFLPAWDVLICYDVIAFEDASRPLVATHDTVGREELLFRVQRIAVQSLSVRLHWHNIRIVTCGCRDTAGIPGANIVESFVGQFLRVLVVTRYQNGLLCLAFDV